LETETAPERGSREENKELPLRSGGVAKDSLLKIWEKFLKDKKPVGAGDCSYTKSDSGTLALEGKERKCKKASLKSEGVWSGPL